MPNRKGQKGWKKSLQPQASNHVMWLGKLLQTSGPNECWNVSILANNYYFHMPTIINSVVVSTNGNYARIWMSIAANKIESS